MQTAGELINELQNCEARSDNVSWGKEGRPQGAQGPQFLASRRDTWSQEMDPRHFEFMQGWKRVRNKITRRTRVRSDGKIAYCWDIGYPCGGWQILYSCLNCLPYCPKYPVRSSMVGTMGLPGSANLPCEKSRSANRNTRIVAAALPIWHLDHLRVSGTSVLAVRLPLTKMGLVGGCVGISATHPRSRSSSSRRPIVAKPACGANDSAPQIGRPHRRPCTYSQGWQGPFAWAFVQECRRASD